MPESDPDSLIGRTFLLPPEENGERLRAKVTKKVVEEIEVKMVKENAVKELSKAPCCCFEHALTIDLLFFS